MHLRRIAGKTLYHLWHQPVTYIKNGGPWKMSLESIGKQEMEAAAHKLPPPLVESQKTVVIHNLTGSRYWYQSAFCLWSFSKASNRLVSPILYDDGSLEKEHIDSLKRIFPLLKVISAEECLARVDSVLTKSRYPSLRKRRLENPLFKKLIDIHAGQSGWKLQIDSDLLFFRRPNTLIEWYDHPVRPLRAEDLDNAYGYPLSLLNRLSRSPVPERVNTGLLGLRSEEFDWDRLEFYCRTLVEQKGASYYQEQALFALHLAGQECIVPDPSTYVLRPKPPEAIECKAVMHHYVSTSKKWYFSRNWKLFTK